MYEVLIAHLRECAKLDPSSNTYTEAADAIEELQKRVPPVPHGRLIDADALEALFWDGQCYFTDNIKYKIRNIETIIPAEEDET